MQWFPDNDYFSELNRIDGEQMLGILEEIPQIMKGTQCELDGRIIFMSMFNDIVWEENDNTEECAQNAFEVSKYARRFACGRWSFLGPGLEKTWYTTFYVKPNREWDRTAGMVILQLTTEPCHFFSSIQCL